MTPTLGFLCTRRYWERRMDEKEVVSFKVGRLESWS